MSLAPSLRLTPCNDAPIRDGDYVIYWMIAARRARHSFALDHAIARAKELGVGLVVLEALRIGYRWASVRQHTFVVQGMADNARAFEDSAVRYLPYVEPEEGAGSGLLEALADRACLVVTDEFPCFFLPRMVAAVASRLPVRLEQVDGNGILPIRAASKPYARAVDFRRHLQGTLRDHLDDRPQAEPLVGLDLPAPTVPRAVLDRWSFRTQAELDDPTWVKELELACDVPVALGRTGGDRAAHRVLDRFLDHRLDRYADGRNHPDDESASELSPWLHFGHLSSHEVFAAVTERDGWTADQLGEGRRGSRSGWWGASEAVESFLDELITWRELGYGYCHFKPHHYDAFDGLPEWAQTTLDEHADDSRPWLYSLADFDAADTHDDIWNAAQRQLRVEGRIHNYLRMLWGKKVLHWTESPQTAFAILIELNNRYALDGRNPNSYSGIGWVFGRFDRAWGPERPIFGKVRYMTSDSTRKKLHLKQYLERWGPDGEGTTG